MYIRLLLTVLLFSIATPILFSQSSLDKVFRKYRNDSGVVCLSFKGDLSKIISSKDQSIKSKIEQCEFFMFDKNEDIENVDITKINTVLNTNKYDLLINVKDKNVNAKVYAVSSGETLSNVYAVVKYDSKRIYLMLSGNIFFEELSKMDFNFEGAKEFKGIFKK